MKIQVKIFATLRLKLGIAGIEIESEEPMTVMMLLESVSLKINADIIPELVKEGEIMVGTIILINGKNILHAEKLETMITEDCEVSVFPPAGGG